MGFLQNFMTSTASKLIGGKTGALNLSPSGSSGTEIYSGFFDEEYLTKLLNTEGIKVYDQMRRSDGQVKMLLSVVKNPIKSAAWSVVPVAEDDEEKEIAAFVEHVLFSDMRKPFTAFLAEALTMVEFGFSVFEIVHKRVKGHKRFGDYLGIDNLAFRHQRSVYEWNLNPDGTINNVRQLTYGDLQRDVLIPGQFLLVFSNEKEGDNYEGISMLRPCYGAWYRKNIYRKLQAIGIERAAKGVPIGKIPLEMLQRSDYEAQLAAFQALLDQLSSHAKNGIALGAGFDITELKLSHDSEKVQGVINSENVEMSKAFLANFMELGLENNGGSYSLGSDLSDIFLSGIEYLAYEICEKLNREIVVPIVRAKYGGRDEYPELTVKGINDKAGKEFADAITELLNAGGIQKSPRLQKHLHEVFNLPTIDEDIAEAEEQRALLPAPVAQTVEPTQMHDCDCGAYKLSETQRREFPVSAYIEDRATLLAGIMRDGLQSRSRIMLDEMAGIIRAGGDVTRVRKAVLNVGMPEPGQYGEQLGDWADRTALDTIRMTLEELGKAGETVKLAEDDMPRRVRERIVQTVLLTSQAQDADLEKAVYFAFNENFLNSEDAETAIGIMESAVDRYLSDQRLVTGGVTISSNVVNNVRNDVFHSDEIFSDIESFIFSNPAPKTVLCQSLVGRVFSKAEYETSAWLPPLHHNCKSYLAAQTIGRAGNKPINGRLEVTDPKLIKQASLV